MRYRLSLSLATGALLVALVSWTAHASEKPSQDEPEATTSTFQVGEMTCGGCEVGVRRVVAKLGGVEEVEASHEEGTATVTYRAQQVAPGDIVAAIEELGYTAELIEDKEMTSVSLAAR